MEHDPEYVRVLEGLKLSAVAGVRRARNDPRLLKEAIAAFIRDAYRAGLVASEITDLFCVSTPNIIEDAGLVGLEGDSVAEMFDEVHDSIRRGER